MPNYPYYVCFKGTRPGVYSEWQDCEPHVIGVSGSLFRGYRTRGEAEEAFRRWRENMHAVRGGPTHGSFTQAPGGDGGPTLRSTKGSVFEHGSTSAAPCTADEVPFPSRLALVPPDGLEIADGAQISPCIYSSESTPPTPPPGTQVQLQRRTSPEDRRPEAGDTWLSGFFVGLAMGVFLMMLGRLFR